ncbi:RibD family protein [Thauera phenylacetica]
MADELVPDWGWACILQARDADWAGAGAISFTVGGVDVHIARGGGWRCARVLRADTVELFDLFLPWVATPGRLAIAQLGQSLDGCIATASGASHYINCLEARTHLHRLRALVDAVVVGVGTVNADDPQLTVRHVAGRNPVRVVLDPRARARAGARLFHDGAAPTVHLVGADLAPACAALPQRPARIGLACTDAGFDPAAVLEWLARAGCRRVLVEGGGLTVSRFVHAGVIDRFHLLVAPLLIGSGRPGLALPPIDTVDEALRPACRLFRCGEDTVFDLDFGRAGGLPQQG